MAPLLSLDRVTKRYWRGEDELVVRTAMHALTRMESGELASATWSELSDTERINVMIARALVHDPVLLIADDPTKGLDERDRDAMLGLVSAIADERGMAVLMSAREVPDGLRAPTTMTLKDGELIAPVGRGARGAVIQFPGGRGGSV